MYNIYKGKKVLVTGNTGFKGSWLNIWLQMLGAEVFGLSNGIPTQPSHFEAAKLREKIVYYMKDIRSLHSVKEVIDDVKPDFVFHLAAQSITRLSYVEPTLTFETNILGTMNVLEALRLSNHKCNAIIITSDKCYRNNEWVYGYRETDTLGGEDPYSASKGAAEIVIRSYTKSFFDNEDSNVKVVSTRAGNVIGGGDWGQDRIVPDCMRSWSKGEEVEIRNPMSTRPWQHVLELLSGYLLLGEKLFKNPKLNGESFNFGPSSDQNYTVDDLIEEMLIYWDGKAKITVHTERYKNESALLKLCCDKAQHILGWYPTLNFSEAVKLTVDWYKKFYEQKVDVYNLSCSQIEQYSLAMKRKYEEREND